MDNLTLGIARFHKQRTEELMEEARIERFLADRKRRDANAWLQRRLHRNRKTV